MSCLEGSFGQRKSTSPCAGPTCRWRSTCSQAIPPRGLTNYQQVLFRKYNG